MGVKDIGLSNFNSVQIQDILDKGKIKPATNQVECHPYFNQEKLNNFCKEKGFVLTAFSPLGSPARPWAKAGEPSLLDDPKIQEVAKKYGKTSAQVILKFNVQRGIAVIPKSVTPARIDQNLDILDFELSTEDMDLLKSFDQGAKGGWWRPCCQMAASEMLPPPTSHLTSNSKFCDRQISKTGYNHLTLAK